VYVNDTNNDEIPSFPITSPCLYFHKTIDRWDIFYCWSRSRIFSRGAKVRFAAKSVNKQTGGSYHPPSALSRRETLTALSRRETLTFYA